ncbi:MAG: extracellular solute-binding protein [Chloroflexi bacterium]|nr:extracellular solute-binding protein [Chloroflexota bacterium]
MRLVLPLAMMILIVVSACSVGVPAQPELAPTIVSRPQPREERGWDKTVAEGKKEGSVLMYTSAGPEARKELSNAFKEKFGINLEWVAGTGPEVVKKLLSERQAGLFLADGVITGATTMLNTLKPENIFEPLDQMLVLPEVTDPKVWRGERMPFMDKDHQVISFIAGYRTYIAVNTDTVKEGEIKSYTDLLDPRWKGKLALDDPTMAGPGSQWLTILLTRVWDVDKGKEFIRNLVKQEPAISRNWRLQVEWVARARYPVGLATMREPTAEFIASGAPLKWVRVAEGGDLSPGTGNIALVKRAANPRAATVFLNWLLTHEGQTALVRGFGSPSARMDVSTAGLDPFTVALPGEKVFWVDESFYLSRPQVIEMAKELFAPLLK